MNQTRRLFTRFTTFKILAIAVMSILAATLASPVSAHEGREVGDYRLVVGLLREPAYEGQLNAVSLVVTKAVDEPMDVQQEESHEDDHEHDHDHDHEHDDDHEHADEMKSDTIVDAVTAETSISPNRVSGLASTLQVEITHLSTTTSRVMPLNEAFDDPGHYIAEFVPTAPGDYRVRFFGSIEGNPIDETFDSGPDTFDTVIASDAIQFPVVLESNRELQNATQGALDGVRELENDLDATTSTASTSMIIGIIGIVFGVIATGFSVFAIAIARKRN